jgi:hypothetical protein
MCTVLKTQTAFRKKLCNFKNEKDFKYMCTVLKTQTAFRNKLRTDDILGGFFMICFWLSSFSWYIAVTGPGNHPPKHTYLEDGCHMYL